MTHLILSIAVGVFAVIVFAILYYIENKMVGTLSYVCPRCDKELHAESSPSCPDCKCPMNSVLTEKIF